MLASWCVILYADFEVLVELLWCTTVCAVPEHGSQADMSIVVLEGGRREGGEERGRKEGGK